MGAIRAQRRKVTARELAARHGVSIRTVQRIAAEPRAEFLARASDRRKRVIALRAEGVKFDDIAERLGIPVGTCRRIIHGAKQRGEWPADGASSTKRSNAATGRGQCPA